MRAAAAEAPACMQLSHAAEAMTCMQLLRAIGRSAGEPRVRTLADSPHCAQEGQQFQQPQGGWGYQQGQGQGQGQYGGFQSEQYPRPGGGGFTGGSYQGNDNF